MLEETHSIYGASSAHRWLQCPGSVALCETVPNTTSKYAEEGTEAHRIAEVMLLGQDRIDWDDVTDEMADAVMTYINYIDTIRDKMGVDVEMKVEHQFSLAHIHPDMYGTNDCLLIDPFVEAYVFDYKHGAGVKVDAEHNEQMMFYALGALHEQPVEKVTLVVVQPRCSIGEPVSTWEVSYADLKAFEAELLAGVARCEEAAHVLVNKPDIKHVVEYRHDRDSRMPIYNPGDKQCQWCNAKFKCPAMIQQTQELTKLEFESDEEPEVPMPTDLSDDFIARVLSSEKAIKSWLSAVAVEAHTRLKEGKKLPGYKLVNKVGNRAWTNSEDPDIMLGELVDKKLLGESLEAFDFKLKSPAQLEKLTGKVGKEIIAEYTERPSNGQGVVPESDKRPAITNADDFEAV